MTRTADLLRLVQWLSPAFPTGAYAYSHGLEVAMATGEVTDAASLHEWLVDILHHGAGRSDAIMLACGLRAGSDLDALDVYARALCASGERLRETCEQGAAFAATTGALAGQGRTPRALPVAVAEAARGLDLPPAQVAALYLHAFAASLVSAAVRFIPLGQTEGQGVLARLHPLIDTLATKAATATLDDIATCAFRADMAAMAHETLDVRIFKT